MDGNGDVSRPPDEPLQQLRPARRAPATRQRWYADRDLILICALVVVLGIYLWNTVTLPSDTPNAVDIGPQAYPWVLVAILVLLLCVLVTQAAIRRWKEVPADVVETEGSPADAPAHAVARGRDPRRLWRLLAVVVLSLAYLQVVPSWGFLVATAVYLLLQVIVMAPAPRRYRGIRIMIPVAFAIVIAVAIQLLFDRILGVFLPAGILTI